jgi:cytoskeletal protein CcmA (bactofilin family)
MFNKDEKGSKENETVIGLGVKVRGDFNGEGRVEIEGSFEGTLTTTGPLHVGQQAEIKAEIKASSAKILGSVIGNLVLTGQLELGPAAKISGDISAAGLAVAQGAIINGRVSINSGSIEN